MEQAVTRAAPDSRKYRLRHWTLGVLSLSLLVIALDVTILNVAIPTLQRDLGASASELQWIVNAYILVFAGLLLTMGTLGDRFGRRRALESGMVIFGTASLAAALSDSSGQLIAARAAQGIGGALIMPSTLSVLVDVFPREERAKAIGIWAAVAALGIPLGMVLGGWLLEQASWGSIFLINLPVVVSALIAGRFLVPESRDPSPGPIDVMGAVLSMAALGALVYSLIEAPERGWLAPLTVGGLGGALLLGAVFVWFEAHARAPMLDVRLFSNARLSAGSGAVGIVFMAMLGTMFLITQYLQFVRGYTPLETGLRLVPLALGFMVGAPLSAVLVGRLGTKKVIAGGMFIVAIMIGGMSVLDLTTGYPLIAALLLFTGVGMSNAMAPATDAVMAAVPESQAGVASALNDTTRQVGGALGVAVYGSILNSLYASNLAEALSGLPASASDAANNSIGGALQVAASAGGEVGAGLTLAASTAFVDAEAIVHLVTGAVVLAGAVLVARFMPAHDLDVVGAAVGRADDRSVGQLVGVPVAVEE
ncbi:MAG: DHA2 family efflux MFS transporter permease subunit [Dehalococcoidia bacterium]